MFKKLPDIFTASGTPSGFFVVIMAFMTPFSRMICVTARVSTPQTPGMPAFLRYSSMVSPARKLEGWVHHSRTTTPRMWLFSLSMSSSIQP